jgi:hypothetical protein
VVSTQAANGAQLFLFCGFGAMATDAKAALFTRVYQPNLFVIQ